MPSLTQLKKHMEKQKISQDIMAQIDFETDRNNPRSFIAATDKMDELLTKAQRLSVMEQLGCCKTPKVIAPFKAFRQKYADKTVEEKINLMDEIKSVHKPPCHLNSDGTLSVYWDGHCPCGAINKLPQPVNVSITYCGCCGGHVRNTFQNTLGVKLRLKEIVSSVISSGGKERCEFLFEIVNPT